MAGMFRGSRGFLHVRTHGDTSKLPIKLDISKSKTSAIFRMVFGGVFAGIALAVFFGSDGSDSNGPLGSLFSIIPLVLIGAGLFQIGRGLLDYTHRRNLTIANGTVTVQGRSLLGREDWSEPLTSYSGARWQEFIEQGWGNSSSGSGSRKHRCYQYVDLAHPDEKKSVPLFVTLQEDETRREWESLAKVIGVSAIDARGGETSVRAAEDVDKSIKDLASEGKIESEWSGDAAPEGLDVDYGGDNRIVVTITARRLPAFLYAIFLAFGGFMLFLGVTDVALVPLIFGAAVAGGAVWYWRFDGQNHRQIVISRDDVSIVSPSPISEASSEIVRHEAIEAVRVVKDENNKLLGQQLTLSTDSGDLKTGTGLSREALEWLRRIIVSAVASA